MSGNSTQSDTTFSSVKIAPAKETFPEVSLDSEFLMPPVLKGVWLGLVLLTLALIFSVPIFL